MTIWCAALLAVSGPLEAQTPAADLSLATPWLWPALLQRLWLVWLALLGGSMGSFLNVVVYRWPLGESLLHPSSRCPVCRHPIRPWHNVPVLGWLWLRGKCRDCGAKISPRYPLVEALMAALFVLLALVEVFPAAANLPGAVDIGALPYAGPPIWLLYGYHACLWSLLSAGSLIAYDQRLIPWKLIATTLVVGLGLPLVASGLHPVAALKTWPDWLPTAETASRLISPTAGLAVGGVLWLASLPLLDGPRRRECLLGYVAAGTILGWQAVCVLALAAGSLCLAAVFLGRWVPAVARIPWLAWLTLAVVGWVSAWSTLGEHFSAAVLASDMPIAPMAIAFAAVFVAWATCRFERRES